MDILKVKHFSRLITWKGNRHHRSSLELHSYAGVKDHDSSFTESLLNRELSVRKWCKPPSEKVPRGFVPVYVGSEGTRFVIPMAYLSMPDFMKVMESTANEFGFGQVGGLKIACEEDEFEEVLIKCLAIHKTRRK